jgi:hypothetical protein
MQSIILTALSFITLIHGLIRFPCGQLVMDRLDPLVEPGKIPTAHLHQIVGGVRILLLCWSSLLIKYRTGSMHLWTPKANLSAKLLARHASSLRTFPITGPLLCTSALEMAPISVFHRDLFLRGLQAV